MIKSIDPISEVEERILREINSGNLSPHQRILSERKLTDIYKVPRMRIHQAIKRLTEKGYLYSKHGSGTYVAKNLNKIHYEAEKIDSQDIDVPFISPVSFHNYQKTKLVIPISENNYQSDVWKSVIEKFHEVCPFIHTDIQFQTSIEPDDFDLLITYPCHLTKISNKLADLENRNLPEDEFVNGIFNSGKVDEKLVALPILRVPMLTSINTDILKQYGLKTKSMEKPGDLMRLGFEIDKQVLNGSGVIGTRYLGPLFHGALYGLELKRNDHIVMFNEHHMKKFLQETKPYIKRHHFIANTDSGTDQFINGKYCFYSYSATNIPEIEESSVNATHIRLPLDSEGFPCEGLFQGSINSESKLREESGILLEYLLSEDAQKIFTEHMPFCLSVRKNVLKFQQESDNPYLNYVHSDFDMRSLYTQMDMAIYYDIGTRLNTESGKYFFGMQDLDKTIENLRSIN